MKKRMECWSIFLGSLGMLEELAVVDYVDQNVGVGKK